MMGITAAAPAGWMRGSIGFAAAKGQGEKRGEREECERGVKLSFPPQNTAVFFIQRLRLPPLRPRQPF